MNIEEIVNVALSSARLSLSGAGPGLGPGSPQPRLSSPGPGLAEDTDRPDSPGPDIPDSAGSPDLSPVLEADVVKARRVLQMMKSQGISMKDTEFLNKLIAEHVEVGDMAMARGMLEVLKHLDESLPTRETFTSLALGYAKQGDWESLQRVIAESEEEQVTLSDTALLDVVFVMCTNGHKDKEHITKIVSMTNPDSMSFKKLLVRLVNRGHEDVVSSLLSSDAELDSPEDVQSDDVHRVAPPRQDSPDPPPHQAEPEDDPGHLPALHHHQPGPSRGFVNAGNTCFMNATIQVRTLVAFFLTVIISSCPWSPRLSNLLLSSFSLELHLSVPEDQHIFTLFVYWDAHNQ